MSSISAFITGAVSDKLNGELLPRLYKASGKAMEEIRNEIITEWFSSVGADSTSMINAFTYPEAQGSFRGLGGCITVRTHASPAKYNHNQSIQGWNSRHGNPIGEPERYVMSLQLYEGIIGLPEKSSQTDWINNNFKQINPLYEVLLSDGRWQEFISYMMKYLF